MSKQSAFKLNDVMKILMSPSSLKLILLFCCAAHMILLTFSFGPQVHKLFVVVSFT